MIYVYPRVMVGVVFVIWTTWIWLFLQNCHGYCFLTHSLISRIIIAKDGSSSSWWNPRPKATAASKIACGIYADLKVLNKNCLWKIRNSLSVSLGIDPWVSSASDFIPKLNPRYQNLSSSPVFTLLHKWWNAWKRARLSYFFTLQMH